jgi:hypothetical protein
MGEFHGTMAGLGKCACGVKPGRDPAQVVRIGKIDRDTRQDGGTQAGNDAAGNDQAGHDALLRPMPFHPCSFARPVPRCHDMHQPPSGCGLFEKTPPNSGAGGLAFSCTSGRVR